jgi:hypothetical protein
MSLFDPPRHAHFNSSLSFPSYFYIILFEFGLILCLSVHSFLSQDCWHKKVKQRFLSCSSVFKTINFFKICLTVVMCTVKLRVHFLPRLSKAKNRVLSKKRNRASKYLYFVYIYALFFIHTCQITQILMQITFSSTLYNKVVFCCICAVSSELGDINRGEAYTSSFNIL